MPSRRLLLALPLVALPVLWCPAPVAAEPAFGTGNVRTERRPLAAFDSIEVHGGIDVVLRQGGTTSVELRADESLLPLIGTRVVPRAGGATLEIGPTRDLPWFSRRAAQVTVDLVTLKALTLNGSSDLRCEALKTPALHLEVRGSGDVRLGQLDTDDFAARLAGSGDLSVAGRALQFALSIAGSGDAQAVALMAEIVSVSIAGSGDANVNARRSLSVSIAGSGDVTYSGDAAVQSSIAGSGTVTRR